MKYLSMLLVSGMLALAANSALAESASLTEFTPRIFPVLVHVNAKGKVTEVSPSSRLAPKVERLLRQNLDELISKPATDHGRPVASQFVINLALQATPRDEGDYFAQFTYVSSAPVPPGSWYWVKIDGYRLALANANDRSYRNRTGNGYRQVDRGYNYPSYNRAPPPSIQAGGNRAAPASAPIAH